MTKEEIIQAVADEPELPDAEQAMTNEKYEALIDFIKEDRDQCIFFLKQIVRKTKSNIIERLERKFKVDDIIQEL